MNVQTWDFRDRKKDSKVDRYFITTVRNIIRPWCLAYNGNGSECEPTQTATRATGADADIGIESAAPHTLGRLIAAPRNNDQLVFAYTCVGQTDGNSLGDLRLGGKCLESTPVAAMMPDDLDALNTGNALPVVWVKFNPEA